jgi:hypothetical protein
MPPKYQHALTAYNDHPDRAGSYRVAVREPLAEKVVGHALIASALLVYGRIVGRHIASRMGAPAASSVW